jgi:hypothetical protein
MQPISLQSTQQKRLTRTSASHRIANIVDAGHLMMLPRSRPSQPPRFTRPNKSSRSTLVVVIRPLECGLEVGRSYLVQCNIRDMRDGRARGRVGLGKRYIPWFKSATEARARVEGDHERVRIHCWARLAWICARPASKFTNHVRV